MNILDQSSFRKEVTDTLNAIKLHSGIDSAPWQVLGFLEQCLLEHCSDSDLISIKSHLRSWQHKIKEGL